MKSALLEHDSVPETHLIPRICSASVTESGDTKCHENHAINLTVLTRTLLFWITKSIDVWVYLSDKKEFYQELHSRVGNDSLRRHVVNVLQAFQHFFCERPQNTCNGCPGFR